MRRLFLPLLALGPIALGQAAEAPTDRLNQLAVLVAKGDAAGLAAEALPDARPEMSEERLTQVLASLRQAYGPITRFRLARVLTSSHEVKGRPLSGAQYVIETPQCPKDCMLEVFVAREADRYYLVRFRILRKVT